MPWALSSRPGVSEKWNASSKSHLLGSPIYTSTRGELTPFTKSPGLCGSAPFGKSYILNNVNNESLKTSVYAYLSFEA
jgi:hypothetical protein